MYTCIWRWRYWPHLIMISLVHTLLLSWSLWVKPYIYRKTGQNQTLSLISKPGLRYTFTGPRKSDYQGSIFMFSVHLLLILAYCFNSNSSRSHINIHLSSLSNIMHLYVNIILFFRHIFFVLFSCWNTEKRKGLFLMDVTTLHLYLLSNYLQKDNRIK